MIEYENTGFMWRAAFELAEKAFEGKFDRAGKPYFSHLYRVVDGCYKGGNMPKIDGDDFLNSAAILHDLLEDCPEWNESSLSFIFPKEVVDLVVILTKSKNEPYLDSYIKRISENKLASRIKLSDLRDNMDIARLPEITQKDIERLVKYHTAYKILEKCI